MIKAVLCLEGPNLWIMNQFGPSKHWTGSGILLAATGQKVSESLSPRHFAVEIKSSTHDVHLSDL